MSLNNEINSMDEVMGNIETSMKSIKKGEIVKGKVITVTDEEAIVNIGYMSDGVLPKKEISDNIEQNPRDVLKENDEIYVYILEMNDGEGNVVLSKKVADREKAWDELQELLKNNTIFSVVVKEAVKGGVVASIKGIRAFIPASQLSTKFVDNLNEFVGKTLDVKLIELDIEKQRVILSRKEVEKEQLQTKKEELLNSIKPGEKIKGVVSRLTKFGAFVDLGGLDGLIHISELSWKRVNDPSEVVSVGDAVEVYVLSVDREKNKVSLALKDVSGNPWGNVIKKYKVGDMVDGTVSKFLNFGVFVEIEPGVEGLVHISEISEERVTKIDSILSVGQKVKVKILDIDEKENRMSLSIKEAVEKPKVDFNKYSDKGSEMTIGDLFKDKLKDFKFD
ncbi:30S ribosomal protein S1 [Clostridium magnum]|uniref:30S ribosomal protein S1 n=1 Tax=Clostridium magnum DSM 2767 TaxID=1121326 RepID=A0A162T1G0_9CLOT|nr:30S ribosomal protein S1 [Clostridium magnum]KZL92129.1 30S ribosomal protein S1 [Clostridium magnum DSM 2767]SHH21231.1 small subunit ribosomal protein S1 [Clostridium magnum DSM 2767]